MEFKKLKFSENDVAEIKELRNKLKNYVLDSSKLSKTYGGCGEVCAVTCSWHCEPTCGLGCSNNCTGTCATRCRDYSGEDILGCTYCSYTYYKPIWP